MKISTRAMQSGYVTWRYIRSVCPPLSCFDRTFQYMEAIAGMLVKDNLYSVRGEGGGINDTSSKDNNLGY